MGDKRQGGRGRQGGRDGHGELFELATRQHGVVSTRQLQMLGYVRNSASKANRVGRLRRLHRGVYAVGHERLTWHSRCMAVVLAVRPSVASHLSAGWLWGLLRYRAETIHVTAPTERRPRRGFVVHTTELAAQELGESEGIPVTGVARTVLDLAGTLAPHRLEGALQRAEELGSFDLHAIEDVLARYRRHPGACALREALDIYRPQTAFTRSGLEERFLELVIDAGLPRPATNYLVGGFELDAFWEAERFGVELDVFETHGTHVSFEGDRVRDDDLLLCGIETIRVTGPRLDREPRQTIARLAAHLARRRRELASRPA